MTRKKTTTGTMGSKRKSDAKGKERADASSKAAERSAKATATKAQDKGDEVIPEVAIALLEAHPTLPDKDHILEAFAVFYREAAERAAAAAIAAAAPPPEPEPEPEPKPKRRTLPAADIASRPRLVSSPAVAPVAAILPAPAAAPVPAAAEPVVAAAQVVEVEEVRPAEILEVDEEAGGLDALLAEAEGASASSDSDDIFALLAKEAEGKIDEDFDFSFQTASDQSNPFFVTASPPSPDETSTVLVEGLEAEVVDPFAGTPVSQEALDADFDRSALRESSAEPEAPTEEPSEPEAPVALVEPTESTTLIQAMPEEEPAESSASSSRKSRKASKKRRG